MGRFGLTRKSRGGYLAGMPQVQLPLFPAGTTHLNQDLAFECHDGQVTYFNGHLIGKTGEFPPEFNSAWNPFRQYQIPVDLVRWGEKNLIMVRVYEKEGNGGIYKGNIQIRTPSQVDFTEISFEFGGKKT